MNKETKDTLKVVFAVPFMILILLGGLVMYLTSGI